MELQKACHTAPSEIRCEDDIPEVRRKLKSKLRSSEQLNKREELHPVYRPNLSVRTCDPCPPVARESVSAASDTLNCRYEDDGEEQEMHQESASENIESYNDNVSNERTRPKRKIQFETKCREFTPSCGGTDSVNFQAITINIKLIFVFFPTNEQILFSFKAFTVQDHPGNHIILMTMIMITMLLDLLIPRPTLIVGSPLDLTPFHDHQTQ